MSCTDWAWWCASPGGRSAVEKEFDAMPPDVQGTFLGLMEAWIDGELTVDGETCCRYGQFNVLYLKIQQGSNPFRVYFVQRGSVAVALHATRKKDQKINKQIRETLKQRAKGGSYKLLE